MTILLCSLKKDGRQHRGHWRKFFGLTHLSRKIASASLVMISVFGFVPAGRSQQRGTLLALSKNDHVLAIVDPVTLKVKARVPVGQDPHEVIASEDGKTAYVSIYGGGSLHEINVIDLVSGKALAAIDTRPFMGPHGLTVAQDKVWFTAEGSKSVGRYDPSSGKFDWCMGTGQDRTHMIYVTPDGKHVYTTNVASGTVSLLNYTLIQPPSSAPPGAKPHEDWVQTVIPVSKGSEGFDVSPDGKELWTASADDGNIFIIDIASRKLVATIAANVNGVNRLKFTLDGKRVLISSLRTGDLFIYDAVARTEIKRLSTGHGAAGILMDPSGTRVFVACSADNYIAVIDLNTLQITARLDVGGQPDGMAWAMIK